MDATLEIVWKSILICFYSYLLGSISFGWIIGKLKKKDVRQVGSHKTGATNVGRTLGPKWGLITAILDAGKAVLVIVLTRHFFPGPWLWSWSPEFFTGLAFLFVIGGHIFPVWLRFKGGAGVGSFLGGLIGLLILGLLDWRALLIIVICWILVLRFFAGKRMSVANLMVVAGILLSITAIPILLAMAPFVLAAVFLIWWAHRENIKRIREGSEPPLKLTLLDKIPFLRNAPDDAINWMFNKLPINWLVLLNAKLQAFLVKLQNLQGQNNQKKP
jgi:glycerol-3-phosphate acyltransferase PlsY